MTRAPTLWPGPKPYGEDRAHLFFGREREIARMVGATFERLGILSAESGAGKSSILAAGYIPELRKARAAGRNVPPVLLVREWGGSALSGSGDGSNSLIRKQQRLLAGAKKAIRDLEERRQSWEALAKTPPGENPALQLRARAIANKLAEDYDKLVRALPSGSMDERFDHGDETDPMATWRLLCDATGGLILILDQVEEFMGSASKERDPLQAENAIRAIGGLYRDESRIKLLVSLRSEYCRTLQRILNRYVKDLSRRIIDLEPLAPRDIELVIKGAAKREGIPIDDDAVAFIQAFVPPRAAQDEVVDDDTFDHRLELADDAFGTSASYLLGVQALLRGYETWCERKDLKLVLSRTHLDAYARSLDEAYPADCRGESAVRSAAAPATPPARVVTHGKIALRAWVDEQLKASVERTALDEAAEDPAAEARLGRWLLHPVLSSLSAQGGFKQHLPLLQLYLDVADRIVQGSQSALDIKAEVTRWMNDARSGLVLNTLPDSLKQGLRLSGSGRRLVGSAPYAAEVLIAACIQRIGAIVERLAQRGVLKLSGDGADRSCELMHDGLSEYVRAWGQQVARSAEAALGAPVAVHGEAFQWDELCGTEEAPLVIDEAVWIGATLRSATIAHVRFRNCQFRGVFFGNCTFEDVTFARTDLSAAVFHNALQSRLGSVRRASAAEVSPAPLPHFDLVRFDCCEAKSTAFIGCRFGPKVEFVGHLHSIRAANALGANDTLRAAHDVSDLTSLSLTNCEIMQGHELTFDYCILRFSQFYKFMEDGRPARLPRLVFRRCDMVNAWIWDAGVASVTIDDGCRTLGLLSFDLPAEAWLDRDDFFVPAGALE